MTARVLRGAAIAIAIVALIDPVFTMARRSRPHVSLIVEDAPSMRLPAGHSEVDRRAVAARVRGRLVADLGDEFEWMDGFDSTASAAVVIGDRYLPGLPEDARVSTVTVSAPLTPNVRIAGVRAPRAIPPSTAVALEASVESTSLAGATTTLVVRAGGAEVGRATHMWSSSAETWRATFDVVPVGPPPITFEIVAEPVTGERTTVDNRARVRVDRAPRLRVLVLEGRPSWASAFVRRALENDPRFEIAGRSQAAPAAEIVTRRSQGSRGSQGSGSQGSQGSLGSPDGYDAMVVGGVERLSAPEIAWIDRFIRVRGGGAALVPDSKAMDAVGRELMPRVTFREALLEKRATLTADRGLPGIHASELLTAAALPADASILARDPASGQAVIWSVDHGGGRLLFSGAMDAWRFRAEPDSAFERWWRRVISALALSARPAVDVSVSPARAAAGERVQVFARIRELERDALKDSLPVAARVGTNRSLRLWPMAEPGTFTGSFIVDPNPPADSVDVTVRVPNGSLSGTATVAIDGAPRQPPNVPLAWLAASRHGVDVGPDDLAALERHLRESIATPSTREAVRPMRSAWWLVPFVSCLSAEWWLRRRSGRR